jgi:sterol desaturase/sphingolipid hydroxylase (fatty acid hydroxylase superfamily)
MQTVACVLGIGMAMLAWERTKPAREWGEVQGWLPRAMATTAFQAVVAYAAAAGWDRWMASLAAWHWPSHGLIVDALAGYVVLTFVYYWWHRARHASPLLWQWLHQLHHSASRLELVTSFYKHPLEIMANGLLSSSILYLFLGLDPAAAALASTLTGLAELFYHWNVRTPHWLGYLIQRPESHRLHHRRDHHTSNFSDLPLWDLLFGTLDNPRHDAAPCGFHPRQELRIAAMLRGRPLTTAKGGRP